MGHEAVLAVYTHCPSLRESPIPPPRVAFRFRRPKLLPPLEILIAAAAAASLGSGCGAWDHPVLSLSTNHDGRTRHVATPSYLNRRETRTANRRWCLFRFGSKGRSWYMNQRRRETDVVPVCFCFREHTLSSDGESVYEN